MALQACMAHVRRKFWQAEKIAKKEESVRLLLDFYLEAQADGEKQLGIALNKMLLDTAKDFNDKRISEVSPEELVRTKMISEIFKNLKTITGGAKKEETKDEGSFLDRKADKKRRD